MRSSTGYIGGADLRTIGQFRALGRGATNLGVNGPRYALERAHRLRHLNAFSYTDSGCGDRSPAGSPTSRIHGVPIAIKDNIDTADMPTTAGTPGLAGRVPPADAPVVARMRAAGAVVIGKTTQHELSLGASSVNTHSGTPRNPLDLTMTAGGSSGGSAVAVAAGIVPAALGTDTVGSVRLPAAFCGLVGYRPTVGRYPGEGVVPVSPSQDTVGPITRTVKDLLLLDSVLAGRRRVPDTANLSMLRLAINPDHLDGLDDGVSAEFQYAMASLELAGVTFVDVDLTELERAGEDAGHTIMDHEFLPALCDYLSDRYPDLTVDDVLDQAANADVRAALGYLRATAFNDSDYRSALADQHRISEAMSGQLDGVGAAAVLHPTSPLLPGATNAPDKVYGTGVHVPSYLGYLRFSGIAGALNLPAVTIPSGAEMAGTPVGIELRGMTGRDDSLLGVAAAVSDVLQYYTLD
ncbi:amidase family protein [Tomitella biformata]|uniref:amidase family protein n=1 Tax=Tomitella biformata TaxID=630403 RepID=UPI0004679FAF|nr:amidase family protein [Tomitella biformata]